MIGVGACEPGQAGVFGGSFWRYEFNTDKSTPDPVIASCKPLRYSTDLAVRGLGIQAWSGYALVS